MSNESIPASDKASRLHDWILFTVKEETALLRLDFEWRKYVKSSQFILLFVLLCFKTEALSRRLLLIRFKIFTGTLISLKLYLHSFT